MVALTEIQALGRGARFYRADLHIHSFEGSHDVTDEKMTPESIVETSRRLGLDVISITDHNEIENVSRALKAADGTGVLVIPGVELSTPQGHLLAYLPSLETLQRFHGILDLADRKHANSRCRNSLIDCLNKLEALGGFGILAHVDIESGFETENPGGSPHKLDVICHRALLGLELKNPASLISYSEDDPDPVRKSIGTTRISKLRLGSKQFLACVLFSDSHALAALGRNAIGDKKVTRVKMDKPSFDALRIGLEDCDARIRIEEHVPATVPYILGVKFSGGFLAGQAIHLSQNLNCIIGGRGTGKSLTFESLRCMSGDLPESTVVDSEVWSPEITLIWQDEAGERHTVQKLVGQSLVNVDDELLGPTAFSIEYYGQGDTARLSRKAEADPLALLQFLDKFVDLEGAFQEENKVRDRLLDLQSKIEEAELQVAQIPQYERALATTQQQLAATEKANAAEVISLQRKIAAEREIRGRVMQVWAEAQAALTGDLAKERLDALKTVAVPSDLAVGSAEMIAILDGVSSLREQVDQAGTTLEQAVGKCDGVIVEQIRQWKAKDVEAARAIELKRKELEASGVKLDMAFIQKLAKDEAHYKKSLEALKSWKPHLIKLRKDREVAVRERWKARDRVATIRGAYGRAATDKLKASLSDLQVSLKFVASGCSPDAAGLIQQAMGWRTNQVPRALLLTEKLTLPTLLTAIARKDRAAISALEFDDGTRPFNNQDAREIIERLTEQKVRFALERCDVHDLPRLHVTRKIQVDGQAPKYQTREFCRLSLGQQQSILLSLLLSSDGHAPLIIDQPEDNLDGEFIYSTFVPVLRRAKERRQIVIVTHNANIAVLGDAEQVIVLKSQADRGIITSRGSIDEQMIRTAACSILEGAHEAFARRARVYGIKLA